MIELGRGQPQLPFFAFVLAETRSKEKKNTLKTKRSILSRLNGTMFFIQGLVSAKGLHLSP